MYKSGLTEWRMPTGCLDCRTRSCRCSVESEFHITETHKREEELCRSGKLHMKRMKVLYTCSRWYSEETNVTNSRNQTFLFLCLSVLKLHVYVTSLCLCVPCYLLGENKGGPSQRKPKPLSLCKGFKS